LSDFLVGYRDPLFGLIVFFALVFIISFFSYWWAIYKAREQDSRLRHFFHRFEYQEHRLPHPFQEPSSHRALLILADAFAKSGDYEAAIAIYLQLQEHRELQGRLEILLRLADLYRRAGFLERSCQIYEEILGLFPRHRKALRSLLYVYERLGDFEGALDVLESLEELGEGGRERGYIEALIATRRGDSDRLEELYRAGLARRTALEPLFRLDLPRLWRILREEDVLLVADLLWYLPKEQISTHFSLLRELYGAKGYLEGVKGSSIFELDLLLHYPKADLEFLYLCQGCKRRFPLPFGRCLACGAVEEMVVEMVVTRRRREASFTF